MELQIMKLLKLQILPKKKKQNKKPTVALVLLDTKGMCSHTMTLDLWVLDFPSTVFCCKFSCLTHLALILG